ncbi:MAG: dienelactone hydrolase family protein [Acidimicrobiaceae bacterium]|nr:dienelactone hydrolase family protein [Acidimicrobiaceae bacterium]
MRIEDIEYTVDGSRMIGHLAVDDERSGTRPGVLVCHEGPGLDVNAKDRAERLADLGYAAFALDYHGEGKPVPTDEMMARLGPLMSQPDKIRALGRAGLDVLLAQKEVDRAKVAAIGFCFGGTMALELARDGADLGAVVGFHSGLGTASPAKAGDVKAAILVCIGADDPMVPAEQRVAFEQEMTAAEVDWRINVYGGAVHSFTNPNAEMMGLPGVGYHQPTDERSWRAMLDFFDEQFGPVS